MPVSLSLKIRVNSHPFENWNLASSARLLLRTLTNASFVFLLLLKVHKINPKARAPAKATEGGAANRQSLVIRT